MAVGVVVSFLGPAKLITGQYHGNTLGQHENNHQAPHSSGPQQVNCSIAGYTFMACVPADIIVRTILIIFTIFQVMLFVIADKVLEGKTVMACNKIDTVIRPAETFLE